jgi:polygalacturonase
VAISNCVFDGTDRGIRIKSTRGRGGIVKNVRVSNIVMHDIREEGITLNLYYTTAPSEVVSDRTPRFRDIHISGVTGNARQAGLLLGLPESRLENVSIDDVNLAAKTGFVIRDARDIRLRSVRIDTEAGPAVTAERVENLSLWDVSTFAPHPATAAVELTNVGNAFVRGCFAAPGTDVFVQVAGSASRSISIDGNDFIGAGRPIVVARDVERGVVVGSGSAAVVGSKDSGGPVHVAP